MTSINLDGVEAWGTGVLSPGRHIVKIESAEDTSTNDKPQVELKFQAIAGAEAGLGIRDWLTLTPKAFGRVVQFLNAVGIQIPGGDFDFPTGMLPGKTCAILVRKEPKQGGGERTVVAAYMANDGQLDADVPGDMAGFPSNGSGASAADDDIPF